ncbi:MAG: 4-hydroxybenzoyl-CoA reductase subunit beta [Hyphomicrobiales bacterium]|nr:4-hydroxybenzoyl-CoA reductase subunit beta [Hyphomicrobiales bacterium]
MTGALPAFALAQPRDTVEAIATRRAHADSCFVAGGTDLLINLRHGLGRPTMLIDLSGIDELAGIDIDGERLRIGAMVTIAAVTRDARIAPRWRALADAAAAVGAAGHRALGTVGGNLCLDTRCIYYNQSEWWRSANGFCLKRHGDICHVAPQGKRCHAAFTGDLAPALLALEATVEIAGANGRRRLPLADLYVEDGLAHLALAADEIVVAVEVPAERPPSAYEKVRVRSAIDYPLAGVAASLQLRNGKIDTLRVALTGTNSRPIVLAGTEAMVGRPVDEKALSEIDRLVQKQVQPMRTTVISAHYRRLAAAGVARRLVSTLATA